MDTSTFNKGSRDRMTVIDRIIRYCLENKLIVLIVTLLIIGWGLMVAPFDWKLGGLPRDPVAVDAIPDIGENQQIVFTEWPGRSPQDVEDQITYPLSAALMGLPGIKDVRSYSYFGFSTVYLIFKDDVDFYWSRSRILEKLNSLPMGTLPEDVRPVLGPDATALGQVFWYTLEGRDPEGRPSGGWDPQELRSVQDWTVKYALQSAYGVAEVASVGGFVREYQVDIDPAALLAYKVTLPDVFEAVKMANIDVGARSIEVNKVEYLIRGLGFIKSVGDIESTVIKVVNNVPVRIKDVAVVGVGPALRMGALDKQGAEAVGGVVVVRHGENPLEVINNVKAKIAEIALGLPKKTLPDGTVSQITIVPFYDRTGLIYETLGTLNTALVDEILVTILVVLLMVMHLRSSFLISGLLPLTVLAVFIGMKLFKVNANIVALSGIAIAIGTIVDMGIIITENILKHIEAAEPSESMLEIVYRGASEVGSAVLTAISTTVISFLPVFTMQAAEGKLFKPLAYTKTFALIASVLIALTIIPPLAHLLFARRKSAGPKRRLPIGLVAAGITAVGFGLWMVGTAMALTGAYLWFKPHLPPRITANIPKYLNYVIVLIVTLFLTVHWRPLGLGKNLPANFLFVLVALGGLMTLFFLLLKFYEPILRWCLANKKLFLSIPLVLVLWGTIIWLGFDRIFGFMPDLVRATPPYVALNHVFPGLGKEFMPSLDEGSFLFMPTTMPHASSGAVLDILQYQDKAISAIPEVESVVGKVGRADSPLDPAPMSMIETIINYKSEYKSDENGRPLRYRFNRNSGQFDRDSLGNLTEDTNGKPYRQWREHIKSPDDIWKEIVQAAQMPGVTSAPELQPIAARMVMLQSGLRAPLGIKIRGQNLEQIEQVGIDIEKLLKELPQVEPATVVADRIVGKPYLEINIDRQKISRYGLHIQDVQDIIEVALGGMPVTTTVEGRERYGVRVRYQRELRDNLESLGRVLVPTESGAQVPLNELADIDYVRGPMMIRSENSFLTGYVTFDKKPEYAEVDVVQAAQKFLAGKLDSGELVVPNGVSFAFAGSYENQIRSEKRLLLVLPLALVLIFLILYFQFRTVATSMLVFSGIFVAWAGGFLMLWLYSQGWFMNVAFLGINLRELFHIHPYNLSVAVWVGFVALFGIATDDGVLIGTYLRQVFQERGPASINDIREATVMAGKKRIRPALMTAATTILALVPVLTSTGKGSDIMVPMAIPSFGGMTVVLITTFVVPTLYAALAERRLKHKTVPQE